VWSKFEKIDRLENWKIFDIFFKQPNLAGGEVEKPGY
jgi:hypothetical protein